MTLKSIMSVAEDYSLEHVNEVYCLCYRCSCNASLTLARLLATILSWQVVPFLGHEQGGYRIVHD